MKTFISAWIERLRTSYWFVPSLLAISATALSFLTVHIDTVIDVKWARSSAWIWAGSPEGARNVLATIAGSTITVAGVVFSITIVALTLASSQFGSRLLRNFMADRGTQIVLGVFVSTFLYCLLVLRTIRGTDDTRFVPFLSVTCGLTFAVASVGFFIYFIHHIPASILAENVIGRVADELQAGIDRLYPEEAGDEPMVDLPVDLPDHFDKEAFDIRSKSSGYVQAIAADDLISIAKREDLILRLPVRPGQFITNGAVLVQAWPSGRVTEEVVDQILGNLFCGRRRTPTQDIEYSIDQLVEVAVRALSPGINDPFTAIACIDWIGTGLIQLANRKLPSSHRYDDNKRLRLIATTTDFEGIAAGALNQIRQFGNRSVAVMIHMLDMFAQVARRIPNDAHRKVILAHANLVREDGAAGAFNETDRCQINERFAIAQRALLRSE